MIVVFNRYYALLKRWAVRLACLLMAVGVVFGSSMNVAMAMGSDSAASVINSRAAAELDRVAGSGTSDQLEGTVDGTVGKIKRSIGEVKGQLDDSLGGQADSFSDRLEGRADELKGKAKRDIGRVKGAGADLADDADDAANSVVESVKDFFN